MKYFNSNSVDYWSYLYHIIMTQARQFNHMIGEKTRLRLSFPKGLDLRNAV